jgi:O-Glycosyl hydrolase
MKRLLCIFLFTGLSFQFITAQVNNPKSEALTITINYDKQEQTIQNIGTSFCWFADPIGRNFPFEKRKQIAELLFSKDTLTDGSPRGIGVSAFRFNVGAGSAEQDTSSNIKDPNHRVECFLSSDGSYNWNKQAGYQWFLRNANAFKVEDLIAFHNSPPVFFTKNGLAHKTGKDGTSNLKPAYVDAYADFISKVVKHFDEEDIHFKYVSPVNEPQWDWNDQKQEGSPYTNDEISQLVRAIDKSFTRNKISSKILISEAAMLTHLVGDTGKNKNQIEAFFKPSGSDYIGNVNHLAPVIAGHSYFTDNGNNQIISGRKRLSGKVSSYPGLTYWQSEYCMLGNGYKDGIEKPSEMDGALFLAKMIHNDLVAGNAAAWQFWNTIEPSRNNGTAARFFLIGVMPNSNWTDGDLFVTKNLYALGHFSRFVRPGMKRLNVSRSDGFTDEQAAASCMVSSFVDGKTRKLVIVAINCSNQPETLHIDFNGFPKNFGFKQLKPFVTTSSASDNLKAGKWITGSTITLPARSMVTLVNKIPEILKDPEVSTIK